MRRQGDFGAALRAPTDKDAGAIVIKVVDGGAAAKADVRVGDRIRDPVRQTSVDPVDLSAAFGSIETYWDPHIVGELNGQQVKCAKLKGQFFGITGRFVDSAAIPVFAIAVRREQRSNDNKFTSTKSASKKEAPTNTQRRPQTDQTVNFDHTVAVTNSRFELSLSLSLSLSWERNRQRRKSCEERQKQRP